MYATDFEYADKRLSDFDCVTCYLDSKAGVSEIDIGCDITFQTVKNNHSSIRYKTSASYENVFSTTFQIMKNPEGKNQNDMYMTYDEVRNLMKWLNCREYNRFKVLSDDTLEDIHYYGSFNVKQKTYHDRIIGLILTFTGNSPYGFGETIKNEFDFTEDDFASTDHVSFHVYGDSDELGNIYPVVTIIPKKDCLQHACEITNATTNTAMVLENLKKDEVVRLDGEHKIITSSDKVHSASTLCNDFNYQWLDLLISNDSQENVYTINTPCYIAIEYTPIRKVGVC